MPISILPPEQLSISEIKSNIDKFWYNETYQRSEAWSPYKRQRLLDSILRKLTIGVLIIRKEKDRYEVLDGQQRIDTLKRFFQGKLQTFPTQPGLPNGAFEELRKHRKLYHAFMNFEVYYIPVYDGNDQELSDIFLRLQEGTPLNSAERLNAMFGVMRDFVVEVSSKNPVFTEKATPIQAYRFAHRFLVAQCALIELSADFEKIEFPNLRFEELKKMYKDCDVKVPSRVKGGVVGTLNFMYEFVGKDLRVVRKKSDFVMVYTLASYFRQNVSAKLYKSFGVFLTNFFTEVEMTDMKDESVKNVYKEYKILRKAGATAGTLRARFQIMLDDLKKSLPEEQSKDPQRFFNSGQKMEIYYKKDKKICQHCHKEVSWEEASFDHIIRHEDGGKTSVENGRLLHQVCHKFLEQSRMTHTTSMTAVH